MRRRHLVHIVEFTRRGFLAVEFLAIPAADAALLERTVVGKRRISLAKHYVRAAAGLGIGFYLGIGVGCVEQALRRLVARTVVLVITATSGTGRRQGRQRLAVGSAGGRRRRHRRRGRGIQRRCAAASSQRQRRQDGQTTQQTRRGDKDFSHYNLPRAVCFYAPALYR